MFDPETVPGAVELAADLDVFHLAQVLGLALVHALVLSFVVAKCGRMLSDRSQYTVVFLAIIPTMVLIITVVKSSLALSLGLVGALSIVRFRTPVKEPEELVYLFLAIAVGLGLGAGQLVVTPVCFAFVVLLLFGAKVVRKKASGQGLFVDVEADAGGGDLTKVTSLFAKSSVGYELRRFMDGQSGLAATYFVDAASIEQVSTIIADIKRELPGADVTVLDTRRQLS